MNVDIAERLAKRRREAGYSQESLAEKLGVSRQAVSKWERSESSPDTDNLIALARLYGVSLDDLLYVDHSIQDDVEFEAADRAVKREEGDPATSAASARATVPASAPPDSDGTAKDAAPGSTNDAAPGNADARAANDSVPDGDEPCGASSKKSGAPESVKIGLGGIHVLDGDDYVHVSWREGVHVKDSKTGEEVHVGWSGIHVNDAGAKSDKPSEDACRNTGKEPNARVEVEGEGEEFAWDNSGVVINGTHYDSWRDARNAHCDKGWRKPSGYTINGEWFDDIEDAHYKYGDEVGRGIPVEPHYFKRAWLRFPYFLVALIVYLLIGFVYGEWGLGLFVFFTVPVYYMIGHALASKQIAPFLAGLYPLASVVWFLYMAFVLNEPHPAWMIFLTIPLVEWAVHEISKWWRRRKEQTRIIDVEGNVDGD